MTRDNAALPTWMATVHETLESRGRSGVFLVAFETYRPDLAKAMAHAFGFRFIDFRAEHMQPLGRDAASARFIRLDTPQLRPEKLVFRLAAQ